MRGYAPLRIASILLSVYYRPKLFEKVTEQRKRASGARTTTFSDCLDIRGGARSLAQVNCAGGRPFFFRLVTEGNRNWDRKWIYLAGGSPHFEQVTRRQAALPDKRGASTTTQARDSPLGDPPFKQAGFVIDRTPKRKETLRPKRGGDPATIASRLRCFGIERP